MTNSQEIERLLDIQGGIRGHSLPPALPIVTTDIRNFVGINERNQVYVDGGLYAMSLLLALEHVGLAAYPLNTVFSPTNDRQIRKLIAADHEAFILFVSVGNFRESVKSPRSFRYLGTEVTLSKVGTKR